MKKNNKTCQLCSETYTYCPTCGEFSHLPIWMNMFDTENCKKIFFATSDYHFDKDKIKAKDVLDKCDLSKKTSFNPIIQDAIDEIMGLEITPIIEIAKNVVEENITEEKIDEISEEVVAPIVEDVLIEEEKPKFNKKKPYYKKSDD